MDDLVQWLGAQLDEDETEARRGYLKAEPLPDFDGWDKSTTAGLPPAVAARVLREIEAKRQLVKLHGRATLHAGGGAQYFDTTTVCRSCEANYQFPELSWPCTTLRLLALPFADRPGYRKEWRP
ncbi:DUF6221 family protein [Streptomyces galilaeus]|uniref:DUF6221 family protein n=1 Tax=Streptomyces galilaeus TaxID=33899 RepID=UPI0038F7F701